MLELKKYQFKGVDFLLSIKRCCLADDPGAGKSVQVITACNKIQTLKNRELNVLILCPNSVKLKWVSELKKWEAVSKYYVINWDKLIIPKHLKALMTKQFDVIIGDESHQAIKNNANKRCRYFKKLLETQVNDPYIYFTTATPASNSAADYYAMLKICYAKFPEIDKLLGDLDNFKGIFCNKVENRFSNLGYEYVGFNNHDRLRKLLSHIVLKRKKRDFESELPPINDVVIPCFASKVIISQSLNISEDLVSTLLDAGKQLPARIASVCKAIGLAKIPAILDWVESFPEDESLVILAWHQDVVKELASALRCPFITSEITSEEERNLYNKQFQSGELKRIVLNYSAGGVGLDFSAAHSCALAELPWSPTALTQGKGRIDRMDTIHRALFYYYFIAEGTIDEKIYNALNRKLEDLERIGV
jgi:SNF2 family DNA or RNA helicase